MVPVAIDGNWSIKEYGHYKTTGHRMELCYGSKMVIGIYTAPDGTNDNNTPELVRLEGNLATHGMNQYWMPDTQDPPSREIVFEFFMRAFMPELFKEKV